MSEDAKESRRSKFVRTVNSDHIASIDKQINEAGNSWLDAYINRVTAISGFGQLAEKAGEFSPEEKYIQDNINRMLRDLKEVKEINPSAVSEEDKKRLLDNLNVLQRREEVSG